MTTVSVVVPVRQEAESLQRSLPHLLEACRVAGANELIFALGPSTDTTHEQLTRVAHGRIVRAPEGKWPAVAVGVRAAQGECLAFADADVILQHDALKTLIHPLRLQLADVTYGRPIVDGPGLYGDWARIASDVWHGIRLSGLFPWVIGGPLFAFRRKFFPDAVPVPRIDDLCIGLLAHDRGARMLYQPAAAIYQRAPSNSRDWIRQKLRIRQGRAALAKLYPTELEALSIALNEALATIAMRRSGVRRLRIRGLQVAEAVLQLVARYKPPADIGGATWKRVSTSKDW